jgi:hypothetical protein
MKYSRRSPRPQPLPLGEGGWQLFLTGWGMESADL